MIAEAFGTTWSKHYCQYAKDQRLFTMIPYTQTVGKIVSCSKRESKMGLSPDVDDIVVVA